MARKIYVTSFADATDRSVSPRIYLETHTIFSSEARPLTTNEK